MYISSEVTGQSSDEPVSYGLNVTGTYDWPACCRIALLLIRKILHSPNEIIIDENHITNTIEKVVLELDDSTASLGEQTVVADEREDGVHDVQSVQNQALTGADKDGNVCLLPTVNVDRWHEEPHIVYGVSWTAQMPTPPQPISSMEPSSTEATGMRDKQLLERCVLEPNHNHQHMFDVKPAIITQAIHEAATAEECWQFFEPHHGWSDPKDRENMIQQQDEGALKNAVCADNFGTNTIGGWQSIAKYGDHPCERTYGRHPQDGERYRDHQRPSCNKTKVFDKEDTMWYSQAYRGGSRANWQKHEASPNLYSSQEQSDVTFYRAYFRTDSDSWSWKNTQHNWSVGYTQSSSFRDTSASSNQPWKAAPDHIRWLDHRRVEGDQSEAPKNQPFYCDQCGKPFYRHRRELPYQGGYVNKTWGGHKYTNKDVFAMWKNDDRNIDLRWHCIECHMSFMHISRQGAEKALDIWRDRASINARKEHRQTKTYWAK